MSLKLLLLDDDLIFAQTLKRQFERKGYTVELAHSSLDVIRLAESFNPLVVIFDLNLGIESSLPAIAPVRSYCPESIILILTGYGSIATCVNAIKAGADDYLTKPLSFAALFEQVEKLVEQKSKSAAENQLAEFETDFSPMSASQLEWEYIQSVLNSNQGNVSATARQLNMHRRTLQRKLNKKAPC